MSLNIQARAQRVQRGDIDVTQAVTLHDGTAASVGDWIVTRHNNRQLVVFAGQDFVKNGDALHVVAIETDGGVQVRHRSHRGTVILPPELRRRPCRAGLRRHGQPGAGHDQRPQLAHSGVPEHDLRTVLPAITRARGENRMYVETTHHVADDHRETPPEQTAQAVLFGVLAHIGA